jgi:hypothetical protein
MCGAATRRLSTCISRGCAPVRCMSPAADNQVLSRIYLGTPKISASGVDVCAAPVARPAHYRQIQSASRNCHKTAYIQFTSIPTSTASIKAIRPQNSGNLARPGCPQRREALSTSPLLLSHFASRAASFLQHRPGCRAPCHQASGSN